jgi:hypothetical protein
VEKYSRRTLRKYLFYSNGLHFLPIGPMVQDVRPQMNHANIYGIAETNLEKSAVSSPLLCSRLSDLSTLLRRSTHHSFKGLKVLPGRLPIVGTARKTANSNSIVGYLTSNSRPGFEGIYLSVTKIRS